jgi:hypothetical protein
MFIILILLFSIILLYLLFSILYGFKDNFTNTKLNIPKKLIISLSTLPSRINNLEKVINSISNNTIKPDFIYLNIPAFSKRENTNYIIPEYLKNIKNVIINRCEDYGPITKLYPTLLKETDPDTIIICIDDDKEYDKYLIENLLKGSTKYPEKCICVSGWNYLNLGFVALPFLDLSIKNVVRKVKILQCFNGVLYKRKFFDDSFKNFINIKPCFTTDDISISKYLNSKNIDIYNISFNLNNKNIKNKTSLGNINLINNNWIKCINA